MLVKVRRHGVIGIPITCVPEECWDKITKKIGSMVYLNVYWCKAISGRERMVETQDEIDDGTYELNDEDWEYTEEDEMNDMLDDILEELDEE